MHASTRRSRGISLVEAMVAGHEVGIDTPVNRFFLYSLRSLELRARGALSFNRRSIHR